MPRQNPAHRVILMVELYTFFANKKPQAATGIPLNDMTHQIKNPLREALDLSSPDDTLMASQRPRYDLLRLAYAGQSPLLRQYRDGYESYFNSLPILRPHDRFLNEKIDESTEIMSDLSTRLKGESWIYEDAGQNGFKRTILAMEAPHREDESMPLSSGKEIVVGQWGIGKETPIHGHAAGFIHEELLTGKLRVNTYRVVDEEKRIVRIQKTEIALPGYKKSLFDASQSHLTTLVHNFITLEPSASLHFFSEHTRDGRGNGFTVQHFDDAITFPEGAYVRVTLGQFMDAKPGMVFLVCSAAVKDLGQHYFVVTGKPVMKPHGIRPEGFAIATPHNALLEGHPADELVIYMLSVPAKMQFLYFHDLQEAPIPTLQ